VSLKDGEVVPIRKTTDALQVDFDVHPTAPVINFGEGWELLSSFSNPIQQQAVCLWSDRIDLAGISAADLSMVNTGTAIQRRGVYTQANLLENLNILEAHVVSVSPLNFTATQWVFLLAGLTSNSPITDDRILLIQGNSWKRGQQDSSYTLVNSDTFAYGAASEFSSDRLYVYRLAQFVRTPFTYVDSAGPVPALIQLPFSTTGFMAVPETQFVQALGLEEFNAVSTAYAIYRGNELQQSYDNP
jgi:hypothetical protein